MRLCLIRHASTPWNEEGRTQGRRDIGLSELGRAQVPGWRLPQGFAGARCVTSPLQRARQTAGLLGCPEPVIDPRLAEMDWGAYEGCRLDELRGAPGSGLLDAERMGLDFRPPGGESPREVAARLQACLVDLAQDGSDCLLVAHKGILRAALVLSLGWDMLGKPPARYAPERALILGLDPEGRAAFQASEPLRP